MIATTLRHKLPEVPENCLSIVSGDIRVYRSNVYNEQEQPKNQDVTFLYARFLSSIKNVLRKYYPQK